MQPNGNPPRQRFGQMGQRMGQMRQGMGQRMIPPQVKNNRYILFGIAIVVIIIIIIVVTVAVVMNKNRTPEVDNIGKKTDEQIDADKKHASITGINKKLSDNIPDIDESGNIIKSTTEIIEENEDIESNTENFANINNNTNISSYDKHLLYGYSYIV